METGGYDPPTEPCKGSVMPDFTMSPYFIVVINNDKHTEMKQL